MASHLAVLILEYQRADGTYVRVARAKGETSGEDFYVVQTKKFAEDTYEQIDDPLEIVGALTMAVEQYYQAVLEQHGIKDPYTEGELIEDAVKTTIDEDGNKHNLN